MHPAQHRQEPQAARGPAAGFTLIELMVTLAVIALVLQFVIANLGMMVPKTKLDAEAKRLLANLDFLRSEARIQGKRYELQLDLDHSRWRMVMPPEERLTSEQTLEDTLPRALEWSPLEQGVRFAGAGNAINGYLHHNRYDVVFDENGQSADLSVFLKLDDDPKLVWTVQMRGLTGHGDLITDENGIEHGLEEVTEGAF